MKLTDIGPPPLEKVAIFIGVNDKPRFDFLMSYLQTQGWMWGGELEPTKHFPIWLGVGKGYICLRDKIYQSSGLVHTGYTEIKIDSWSGADAQKKDDRLYCCCPKPQLTTTGFTSTWVVCKLCKKEKK